MIVTQNLLGADVLEWVEEFESNEELIGTIRKNAVRVIHEIISLHVDDSSQVTKEDILSIARQYLSKRCQAGLFVAVLHLNDDHLHIHVCGSPWEVFGGKSLRMSRKEFQQFKQDMELWQRQKLPMLTHSQVDH